MNYILRCMRRLVSFIILQQFKDIHVPLYIRWTQVLFSCYMNLSMYNNLILTNQIQKETERHIIHFQKAIKPMRRPHES